MSPKQGGMKARIEDEYAHDCGPDLESEDSRAGMMTVAFCIILGPSPTSGGE